LVNELETFDAKTLAGSRECDGGDLIVADNFKNERIRRVPVLVLNLVLALAPENQRPRALFSPLPPTSEFAKSDPPNPIELRNSRGNRRNNLGKAP
jgi:hypothetical protein